MKGGWKIEEWREGWMSGGRAGRREVGEESRSGSMAPTLFKNGPRSTSEAFNAHTLHLAFRHAARTGAPRHHERGGRERSAAAAASSSSPSLFGLF